MKKTFNVLSVRLFGLAVVIAAIALNAMLITGCNDDSGENDVPPENKPVKDRWGKYIEPGTTATLDFSVAGDGVCKITVGGTAEPFNETDGWNRWKANASYAYTAKAGTSYKYTFEAWTESGTRDLGFQYCVDNDEKIYLWETISITNTRKTYTVYGGELSNGALNQVEFQCADQLGTFYVKMLEIKEYTTGKLTITNFSGSPGLTQNSWVYGNEINSEYDGSILYFCISASFGEYSFSVYTYEVKGNTLIIPVWEVNQRDETVTPYSGNKTIAAGNLSFDVLADSGEGYYINKVPITFTKGNATINFGTQMEKYNYDGGGNGPQIPPVGPGGFVENVFELPVYTSADRTTTGEYNSKLYKFTGEAFTKIKNANPGSFLEVTYRANVSWACGEIGWKSITDAGPVIIGNGSSRRQTVKYNVEDLVLGTDNFTIHIFNGADLADVTLHAAPDGYVPVPNPKATAGATKIVLPQGHNVFGNGDLSKADFKKITTAASGTLVFYFDYKANTTDGFLKFGPKSKDPYKHYGISNDGTIVDGDNGWRFVNVATKTITYNVSDIKKAVADAAADFPEGTFEWLEINMGIDNNADLLYIELKP